MLFKRKGGKRFSIATANGAGHSLVILDDIFPHPISAFRLAEFNAYLSRFPTAAAYSTGTAFPVIGEKRNFEQVREEYLAYFPEFVGRVFPFNEHQTGKAKLLYFVFLQNARRFFDVLERSTTPFAFTLYPGGAFMLEQPASDAILREICSLPNFRKVITTQPVSYHYVIDRELADPAKVEFIYGGVFPSDKFSAGAASRKLYRTDKPSFDICFVAFKYMARGIDKGYDIFVDVARELCRRHDDVFFHVVGPFDESDIDVADLRGRIHFHGVRPMNFFLSFYSRMDMIVAPNVPFTLMPGAFDGFPTGSCIEAGFSGVPVFCTDSLNQNTCFRDGEEIVILPRSVKGICQLLSSYRSDYERLMRIGAAGQAAFMREFDIQLQMQRRIEILSPLMSG